MGVSGLVIIDFIVIYRRAVEIHANTDFGPHHIKCDVLLKSRVQAQTEAVISQ